MKSYSQFIVEAKRRIGFKTVLHGTSKDSAEKIKKSGFNTDEVHAATHRDTARSFGSRTGDSEPTIIRMRIPAKSIKSQPEKGANVVKTKGQRGIDSLGRKHYSVVMNPEYASKKIIKTTGIIQKPKIPKRFQ